MSHVGKELQRRNKLINSEINKVSSDQQAQHYELKSKFESSLQDIQQQLKLHGDERNQQVHENKQLRDKIQQLLKYEHVREEHYQHQLNTKLLEYKLLDAKLQQEKLYNSAQAQKYQQQQDTIQSYIHNEQQLKLQLNSYADKFNQVQTTLTKSNTLFNTFKHEMDKMNKNIKLLEKDKLLLNKKNNESQATIINMFEQNTADKQAIDKLRRQNEKLKSLCNTLQSQLKTKNNTVHNDQLNNTDNTTISDSNTSTTTVSESSEPQSVIVQ